MFLLVFAAGLVYAALLAATLTIERGYFFDAYGGGPIEAAVLSILVVPLFATWLAAELLNAAAHTRILDGRVRRLPARLLAGLIAGLLGVAAGTLMLILLDRALPDAVLTGAAAAASTAIVLLPLPRQRPFACPNCGYDLSGASPASGAVCTECGFALL